MTSDDIAQFIERRRFPLSDEKELQRLIADEFGSEAIDAEREVRLGAGDIIDFRVGTVGVEVKIKGGRREIYRQCCRYLQYEQIESLVLATNVAMGMPPVVSGKRVVIANLGRAWL